MKVMIKNKEGYITKSIGETMEEEIYETKVARAIGIGVEEMREVRWETHTKVLKSMKARETIKKILWGDNPTRVRLNLQGKCTSGLCLLCGEKDVALHFLVCRDIVDSAEWKREEVRFQQKAEKMRVPGFLVKATLEAMNGIEKSSSRQPEHRRGIFERQRKIGWENYAKGRIHQGWYKYRRRGQNEKEMNEEAWSLRLVKEILTMLNTKWKIRCDIMEEEGKKREEEELQRRCTQRQMEVTEDDLLRSDRYLLQDRYRADTGLRATTIKEWERTLELAILAKEKKD